MSELSARRWQFCVLVLPVAGVSLIWTTRPHSGRGGLPEELNIRVCKLAWADLAEHAGG